MDNTNLLSVNSQNSLSEKWYTVQELAGWCGLSVDRIKHLLGNELSYAIDNTTQKKGGYHNSQVFYSEHILNELKAYQIGNTPNAIKNKEAVISGNTSFIQAKTIETILNDPSALMQLVAMSTKKVAELQPKADIYDRICNADSLKTVDQVASNLGFGTKNFFALLRGMGIFYYSAKDDNGERVNLPKQEYKERGYFVTKEEPYKRGDKDSLYTKIYVTGKGEIWLSKKIYTETAEKILEKSIFYDVAKEAGETEDTIKNFCYLTGLTNLNQSFTTEALMGGYADENGFTDLGRNYIIEKFKTIKIAEKNMRPNELGKAE